MGSLVMGAEWEVLLGVQNGKSCYTFHPTRMYSSLYQVPQVNHDSQCHNVGSATGDQLSL